MHLRKVLHEKEKVYFLGYLAERKEVQRAVKWIEFQSLIALGGGGVEDDRGFAENMNISCSRYGTHDFRSVIDDIISSTKTGGKLHIEEKKMY